MTLADTIRTNLRTVVGSTSGLGDAWYYKAITSAPTMQTAPTWSADWTASAGVKSGDHIADIPDQKTGRIVSRIRAFLRLPDTVVLPKGSLVTLDQTTIWAVDEPASSAGLGTIKYLIGRSLTEKAQAGLGGGG